LVACYGLLSKLQLNQLPKVYELSRVEPNKRPAHKNYQEVQKLTATTIKPRIKFMGVWDTVGALGAPTPMLGWVTKKLWVKFHDTTLRNVDYAYHALAIDELREPFKPSIWTQANDAKEIKQVWFSGSHSNVGGGFPDHGLSDTAFNWMIKMATQKGVEFDRLYLDDPQWLAPNYSGSIVNLYKGVYKLLGTNYRQIGQMGVNEMIHQSVIDRHIEKLECLNPQHAGSAIKKPLDIEPY
jgi:uncharacterized protein (DUF2235 family)